MVDAAAGDAGQLNDTAGAAAGEDVLLFPQLSVGATRRRPRQTGGGCEFASLAAWLLPAVVRR